MSNEGSTISRRDLIHAGGAIAAAALVPAAALARPETMARSMSEALGGVAPRSGRVKLDVSPLAENGNAVPVTISVESAMTAADHVKTIYLFSPENPLPDIARFHLGPRSGQARVMTTVRLAASQRVQAVAVLSDGSVWSDSAEVIVTLSACIDAG
jgi:sulfur-oxidizing protein SoxY